MDKSKSYEFTFLYLVNKCILLFKYIDIKYQKDILQDIKIFINNLEGIFSKAGFDNNKEKKNKIFEILIKYFEKLIDIKIYNLMNIFNKDIIINDIEQKALEICNKEEQKKDKDICSQMQKIDNQKENQSIEKQNINSQKESQSIEKQKNENQKESQSMEKQMIDSQKDHKLIEKQRTDSYNIANDLLTLEKKINTKIKTIFSEIENNIKTSLKEYFIHTDAVEYDLDKKFNDKIKDLKDSEIRINNELENKIRKLSDIFNQNIEQIFNNLNQQIFDEKINIEKFNIVYEKEDHELKLYYYDSVISSSKINIKGLIGPKGPQGPIGNPGGTPIIRQMKIDDQNKIKFIIQEGNNIYEVISDKSLPNGPVGQPGPKGDVGSSTLYLKWDQDNVMKIDNEHDKSLIFLKSVCIGEKSHCLKDNSLSLGGGICYQNNSVAIGQNSKTLDSDSIAIYGSSIGKRSFSYRADNVDEDVIEFGKKDKAIYNINEFNIKAKRINLDCDILNNNKIKELEEKIICIEKKITDILKKI